MQGQLVELRADAGNQTDAISRLQREIEDLRDITQRQQDLGITELITRVGALEQAVSSNTNTTATLQGNIEAKIARLNESMATADADLQATLEAQIEGLNGNLAEVQRLGVSGRQALNATLESYQTMLSDSLHRQNTNFTGEIDRISLEIGALSSLISGGPNNTELNNALITLNTLFSDVANLRLSVTNLIDSIATSNRLTSGEMGDLNQTLAEHSQALSAHNAALGAHSTQLSELQGQFTDLQTSITLNRNQTTQRLDLLGNQISEVNMRVGNVTSKVAGLERDRDSDAEAFTQLNDTVGILSSSVGYLRDELVGLEEKVNAL
mgnify:CR=1 FL=1